MQAQNKHKTIKLGLAVAALVALSSAGTAYAATATNNLPVTATVAANCTIDASGGLAFGSYDPVTTNATAGSDLDNTGTINFTCSNGAAATITLGQGANADTGSTADAPARRMTDGTNFLAYDLYSDAGRTTVWGDSALSGLAKTGTGLADTATVYGRVPKGQNAPTGSYTDTVVATITF